MDRAGEHSGIMKPMTEADFAGYLEKGGTRVIQHKGRYWKTNPTGFYYPVHEVARMSLQEATRPSKLCWGFRTTLRDEDAPFASGSLPVHILENLQDYDLFSIKQSRRTNVRKFLKMVELIEIKDPEILREQAYEIVLSDHARHGYGKLPSREEYQAAIDRFFKWNMFILGGLVDGRLGGFIVGAAVGSTAYIEEIQISSDVLNTGMSPGLIYELIQVCKRSPGIKEVVHALHVRENETLSFFKEGLGFQVKHIPSMVCLAPFTKQIIRRIRPHTHYRFFGTD